MKFTLIFLLSICTFTTLYSQGLFIKWEKKIESDTMGMNWMNASNFAIDKEDEIVIFVDNSFRYPGFIWLNQHGDILNFRNLFHTKPNESLFHRKLNFHYSKATNFNFHPSNSYVSVTLFADPLGISSLQELYTIESNKNSSHLVRVVPESTEEDYFIGANSTLINVDGSTLVFYSRRFVSNFSRTGKTIWKNQFEMDSILYNQSMIQAVKDSFNNEFVLLSGKADFKYNNSLTDTNYCFQIRKFGVENTKDSLFLKDVFTITQYDLGLTDNYLIPKNIFARKDDFVVIGNLQKYNDTIPYFDNANPFIAFIDKNGNFISCKKLPETFFINEACESQDGKKLGISGFEFDKSNLKNRKLGVVEFDLETENVRKVTYADSKNILYPSNIRAFSNGDYAVTTSALVDSVTLNNITPYFFIHRITSSTTSVDETVPQLKTTVRLEPNPSSEYATVRFMATEDLKHVNLVDSRGTFIRNIYTKDVNGSFESSVTFRVSDLANGMYYVVIGNSTKTIETVPLSIQR